jgi:hypothetical protein
MNKHFAACLVAGVLVGSPAMAAESADAKPIVAVVVGKSVKTEVQVLSIDLASRKVSLAGPDGKATELVVGPEVKNLAQVKVGDRVITHFSRNLSVSLRKGSGIRETSIKSDSSNAAVGHKPGAAAADEINFVADVIAVNSAAQRITIKGAKGRSIKLDIKDPDVFKQIAVGDQVEGTYLQVLAIGVLPPAAKK